MSDGTDIRVTSNSALKLRDISDKKTQIGDILRSVWKDAWYFDNWYEKISLVILMILGFIKLMELIF